MVVAALTLSPAAQIVEDWLLERGMNPAFESDFPISEIDMERSLRNQARLEEPINEDTVNQYAADMQLGDEFPPVILWADKKAHVLVSGIHRTLAAMEAGVATLPAFVLATDNRTAISVLTYEANTTHGRATTVAERVQQAIFLVENGLSQGDAAKLLHVSTKQIARLVQIRRARERLKALGYKRPDRLPDFTAQRLDALRADEVMLAAANLVRDAGLGTEQTNDLVARANKLRADSAQLSLIAEERKLLKSSISAKLGGTVKLPRSVAHISRVLGATAKVAVPSATDLKPVPQQYKNDMLTVVAAAQQRLSEIATALRLK